MFVLLVFLTFALAHWLQIIGNIVLLVFQQSSVGCSRSRSWGLLCRLPVLAGLLSMCTGVGGSARKW
jgi:hypothetical protein